MGFRDLSRETQEVLREIRSPSTLVDRILGSEQPRVLLIEKVGASGEVAAIPALLGLLFDKRTTVAAAASKSLHRLVSGIALRELPALDQQMRSLKYWRLPEAWREVRLQHLPNLAKTAESRSSVLALASLHPNGHVRAAAVRELAKCHDGRELPFLLVRLNDWVPSVRIAAKQAVQERMVADQFEPFARSMFLVVRLTECQRDDHTDVVHWVMRQLTAPHQEQVLRGLLTDADPLVRRKCFELTSDVDGPHLVRIIAAGLDSSDVLIRLRAAQRLRRGGLEAVRESAIARLESDRFMPIRREALRLKIESRPESAVEILEKALLDRSAALREFARFQLGKRGRQHPAAVYRQALLTGAARATAIMGLAECGTPEDLDLVRSFLSSTALRERIAALRAAGNLGTEAVLPDVLMALADDSGKVVRAAQKAIERHIDSVDPQHLWTILASDERTHVRLAALDLLDQTGSWIALPFLIRAAAFADDLLARRAQSLVRERFNRVCTQPGPTQLERLRRALDETPRQASDSFRQNLDDWLTSLDI